MITAFFMLEWCTPSIVRASVAVIATGKSTAALESPSCVSECNPPLEILVYLR